MIPRLTTAFRLHILALISAVILKSDVLNAGGFLSERLRLVTLEGRTTELLRESSGRCAGRQARLLVQGHLLHRQLGENLWRLGVHGRARVLPQALARAQRRLVVLMQMQMVQPPRRTAGCEFVAGGTLSAASEVPGCARRPFSPADDVLGLGFRVNLRPRILHAGYHHQRDGRQAPRAQTDRRPGGRSRSASSPPAWRMSLACCSWRRSQPHLAFCWQPPRWPRIIVVDFLLVGPTKDTGIWGGPGAGNWGSPRRFIPLQATECRVQTAQSSLHTCNEA